MRFSIPYLLASLAFAADASDDRGIRNDEEQNLTILVYDLAGVPETTLREAEAEVDYLFRSSGTRILWLNCTQRYVCDVSSAPGALNLRVIARPPKGQGHDEAIGRAYLVIRGDSDYMDVYIGPIRDLLGQNGLIAHGQMLGYAMAHEIGHILLGRQHNPATVMRAHWKPADLPLIHQRRIHFSRGEVEGIRGAVGRRSKLVKAGGTLAARATSGKPEPGRELRERE